MTKKMRVWPNIIISTTDGSAMKAAMPIRSPMRSIADRAQDVRQRFLRADQRLRRAAGDDRWHCAAISGEPGAKGIARRVADRLRANRADRAGGDQQVEDGAEQQRADQADRDVALRVHGFFRRGRDRVEADISEEDRRRRADHAVGAPAVGNERLEVRAVEHRQGQDDEHRQRRRPSPAPARR